MLSFVGWQFVGTIIPLNIHNAETATILPTINHNTLSSGLQQYGKLPPCSSSAMKAVSQDLYIVICAVWSHESSPVHDHSAYACWMSRCVLVPVWLGRCLSSSDWSRFLLRLVSPELGQTGPDTSEMSSAHFHLLLNVCTDHFIANIYTGVSFASVVICSHRIIN